MNKILKTFALSVMVSFFSCEDQTIIIKCSDCVIDEPVTAELYADLDPDYFYGSLIQIWEGNVEDSILFDSYISYSDVVSKEVTINRKYTITATYHRENADYIAVDSATPRVKYEKTQCDNPCYYIYDTKCNLKLKYTR